MTPRHGSPPEEKGKPISIIQVRPGPGAQWELPYQKQRRVDLGVALESQPWSSSHFTRLHQISADPRLCKGRTVWRSAASTRGDLHHPKAGACLSTLAHTSRGVWHVLATRGRVSLAFPHPPSALLSGPARGPLFYYLFVIY